MQAGDVIVAQGKKNGSAVEAMQFESEADIGRGQAESMINFVENIIEDSSSQEDCTS